MFFFQVRFNLGANASQLNLSATKVESFPADLFLDFVCLVEQLLVEVLALDPYEGLDSLADQLAVGFQLLGLAPQLLVPGGGCGDRDTPVF